MWALKSEKPELYQLLVSHRRLGHWFNLSRAQCPHLSSGNNNSSNNKFAWIISLYLLGTSPVNISFLFSLAFGKQKNGIKWNITVFPGWEMDSWQTAACVWQHKHTHDTIGTVHLAYKSEGPSEDLNQGMGCLLKCRMTHTRQVMYFTQN